MATLIPYSSSPVNFNSLRYPFNHHLHHLWSKKSRISLEKEYCCMVKLAFERPQAIRRCFPTSLSRRPHHRHPRNRPPHRRRSNCCQHAPEDRSVVNVANRIPPIVPRLKRSFVTRLPGDGSLSLARSVFTSLPMASSSRSVFSCTRSKMIWNWNYIRLVLLHRSSLVYLFSWHPCAAQWWIKLAADSWPCWVVFCVPWVYFLPGTPVISLVLSSVLE